MIAYTNVQIVIIKSDIEDNKDFQDSINNIYNRLFLLINSKRIFLQDKDCGGIIITCAQSDYNMIVEAIEDCTGEILNVWKF